LRVGGHIRGGNRFDALVQVQQLRGGYEALPFLAVLLVGIAGQ